VAFAVRVGEVAIPLELVVTMVVVAPAKLAEAPVVGAVKVTLAPLTGLPPLLSTVTCNAVAKAVPTVVVCALPAVAVMLAATGPVVPAVLVRLKLVAVVTPGAVADTA
jgi:hypothetical protein